MLLLGKLGDVLQVAADEGEAAAQARLLRALAQLGQHLEADQHGADDIGGDVALVVLGNGPLGGENAGVLDDGIEAIKGAHALAKLLDGLVAGEIQRPHVQALGGAFGGGDNLLDGGLALGLGAHGKDDTCGAEADQVLDGLEAQAGVGAGDDDDLVGEVGLRVRQLDKEL